MQIGKPIYTHMVPSIRGEQCSPQDQGKKAKIDPKI